AKQIDEKGVDVIYMNSDVTDSIDVAREKGIKAISYHSDVLSFFPDTILTGVTFTWGDYYRQRVQAACDGSWASGNYFGGFKERNVALGRYGQGVPEGIKAVVTERQRQMEAGEWDVFTGPIRAQDGTLLVPNGKRLSDAELRTFTTLTEGFVGTVPNLADCDGGASDAAAVCREIQQ
ncbi:MAG TPA: hypothetical protein VEY30_14415, partial [Myxococcaceae bacterium]|nr:hypothetical protein [Myxococcaceae bacterium]